MVARIFKGSMDLGTKIRMRRKDLNLTIAEAASRAGIGTKTWSRYEAGESIRRDKIAYVCKALNWHELPGQEKIDKVEFNLNDYKKSGLWSKALADKFGNAAAISFIIGSDVLLDSIEQDLEELSKMPKGTHIGELGASFLDGSLPRQFSMYYDYDFLWYLRATVVKYRLQSKNGELFVAHTVVDELVLYLIVEESKFLMEGIIPFVKLKEWQSEDEWADWVFDIFDDVDILTFLYSDCWIDENNPYHFKHWQEKQFYCKNNL